MNLCILVLLCSEENHSACILSCWTMAWSSQWKEWSLWTWITLHISTLTTEPGEEKHAAALRRDGQQGKSASVSPHLPVSSAYPQHDTHQTLHTHIHKLAHLHSQKTINRTVENGKMSLITQISTNDHLQCTLVKSPLIYQSLLQSSLNTGMYMLGIIKWFSMWNWSFLCATLFSVCFCHFLCAHISNH